MAKAPGAAIVRLRTTAATPIAMFRLMPEQSRNTFMDELSAGDALRGNPEGVPGCARSRGGVCECRQMECPGAHRSPRRELPRGTRKAYVGQPGWGPRWTSRS